MGGMRDTITAATKKELNEKLRNWKKQVREMDWDIRFVTKPEKNDDGSWEVSVSAHS